MKIKIYPIVVVTALILFAQMGVAQSKVDRNSIASIKNSFHDEEMEVLESKTYDESAYFRGFSTLIVGSGDTLIINGDLSLGHYTKVLVEEGATIMVYGNLKLNDLTEVWLDGSIHVLGSLNGKEESTVSGSGYLRVIGQTVIHNTASIFGTNQHSLDSQVYSWDKSVLAKLEMD